MVFIKYIDKWRWGFFPNRHSQIHLKQYIIHNISNVLAWIHRIFNDTVHYLKTLPGQLKLHYVYARTTRNRNKWHEIIKMSTHDGPMNSRVANINRTSIRTFELIHRAIVLPGQPVLPDPGSTFCGMRFYEHARRSRCDPCDVVGLVYGCQ